MKSLGFLLSGGGKEEGKDGGKDGGKGEGKRSKIVREEEDIS